MKFVECMRKRFKDGKVADKKNEQSLDIVPAASGARYDVELFTNEAIWQLAEETIKWLLDDATYTRGHLLNILSVAKFSPTYTRYFRAYNLIKETDLHYS